MKKLPLIILILAAAAVCAIMFKLSESKRMTDPTGKFTAVVTYRNYQTYIPSAPGDSSGKSGFITIYDHTGTSYGRIPLDMIAQADDLQWTDTGATIPAYCTWNFETRTYRYWNSDQTEETIEHAR
ncbi:hypothetical protein NT6N_20780 [Oceaniferula spumae]|uniref:Uncharacterized protein n=1 Tax=Oceaniferula spumae TaxID=2979115 RepID=A0AAT9FM58_9BACT